MHVSIRIQNILFDVPKQMHSNSVVHFQKTLTKRERRTIEIILNDDNTILKRKRS